MKDPIEKSLSEYEKKRNFGATPEPGVADAEPGTAAEPAVLPEGASGRFVIQEHHARSLHWDLRLEKDGVLKSWAVPKGVPLEKGIKRLAVETEDHPLGYLSFAGVIPEGQYGAGLVEIWDRGYYATVEHTDKKWYVVLMGERVRGLYTLIRTKENQWLLWKKMDENESVPGTHL